MLLQDRRSKAMLDAPTQEKVVARQSQYLRQTVDLNGVTEANFFNMMKLRLNIPPEDRDDEDIEILKACTKYLEFFNNIIYEDPEDRSLSFYNGCKYLRYNKMKKGEIMTKHKDNSDEFYITLSGKIGVFVPRARESIDEEIDSIYWMRKKIGLGFDIKRYHLDQLLEEIGPRHVQSKHIKKFQGIKDRENRIVYRDDYIQEITKGLSFSDFATDSWVFTDQDVSHFTIILTHRWD